MHGLSNTTSGVFARRRRLCRPESAARRPFHVEGLGQLAGCCVCARPYRYAGAIARGVLSRAYLRPRRTARCDLVSSSMGVKNRVASQRDSGSGDGGELAGDNVAEKVRYVLYVICSRQISGGRRDRYRERLSFSGQKPARAMSLRCLLYLH
jgi:hypothetical protein